MRTCAIEGCGGVVKGRGLCGKHYMRLLRRGDASDDALSRRPPGALPSCTIDGCGRETVAHGLCATHYDRWLKHGDPRHGGEVARRVIGDDEARFWAKVQRCGPMRCWEWQGAKLPKGYGYITVDGQRMYAHRLAYEWATGRSAEVVRHSCDNPPCVNPAHLLGGSTLDNITDKIVRGRQPRGEAMGSAKLTESDVREIRALIAAGISDRKIAPTYGVHPRSVANIRLGKTWRHVL